MLDASTASHYRDLAAWVAERCRRHPCPVIGINGAQGSGKSTAAAFVAAELAQQHGLKAAVLSLDDFYRSRAERQQLAMTVHPLLATRGVPGTHDVALGLDRLQAAKQRQTGRLSMPRFAKADDDRVPLPQWAELATPVDVILFEGWCVGTPPQPDSALQEPVNELEATDDADGRWRRHVNAQLVGPYAAWFAQIDAMVFLQVPDFAAVHRWRGQQERETARTAATGAAGVQTPAQLARFIQYYQRLTLHALAVLPLRADVVLRLDDDHRVCDASYRGS